MHAREHREEAGQRHDEHVAVRDMGELVGENALDLLRVEPVRGRDDGDPACFWLRPVANAFGIVVSMIATCGFRMFRHRASRSTVACSSALPRGVTTRAPEAFSASLSEVKYWKKASPTTITSQHHETWCGDA